MNGRLSIVIPMYNEAGCIEGSLRELAASSLAKAEFVLVDDGSDDATARVAHTALDTVGLDGCVLVLPHGGKGAAVLAGLAKSTGDVVGFLDADLSSDLSSVEHAVGVLADTGADAVFASRRHPDSVIGPRQPLLRELAGRVFNLVVLSLGLTQMRDTQCGLKLFSAQTAAMLVREVESRGYVFDVELAMLIEAHGLELVEVPVDWHHDEGSAVRLWGDLPTVVADLWRLLRRSRSIRRSG